MADVGHAGADEHFVDLGIAGHGGQRLDIVGIVRAGQNRLLDFTQVDVDDFGVLGVGYRLASSCGLVHPLLHRLNPPLQGTRVSYIAVTLCDHPTSAG